MSDPYRDWTKAAIAQTEKQERMMCTDTAAKREELADKLQADFYATVSGMNEVIEFYGTLNRLTDDEIELEAAPLFEMEQFCGINGGGINHKLVSDLCWQMAQLKNFN